MKHVKTPLLVALVLFALLPVGVVPSFGEKLPSCTSLNVPYVQQMTDYCGPAVLTSVLRFWSIAADQVTVGKSVFDPAIRATNGADMIIYAREKGLAAYSWNSSMSDLKAKLSLGVPVIVLQDYAQSDRSGHYRVATGYDDDARVFYVNDPYEPQTKTISYEKFENLWASRGYWALLVCSADKDTFKKQLDEQNAVVHVDLAYVYYRKGDLEAAQKESRLALAVEPHNYNAQSLLSQATIAAGARAKTAR